MKRVNLATLFLSTFLLLAPGALAWAALEVEFEEAPLFSEANIMPGDSVSRTVKVTNVGEAEESVEVLVNNTFSDGLADYLQITVTSSLGEHLAGNLSAFFASTPLGLGTLLPNEYRIYTFTVELPVLTGNAAMLKQAGFDLIIGFVGGERVSDNEPEGPGGGGGGGSSGSVSQLTIFNEQVASVSVNAQNAVITWNSNLPATSYLVCGVVGPEPFVLTNTPPLFGYQFALPEVDHAVLGHSLTVTDLVPNEEYECRPAGRRQLSDPFTVGQPVVFGFPGPRVEGLMTTAISDLPKPAPQPLVLGEQVSVWPFGGAALGWGNLSVIETNRIMILLGFILVLWLTYRLMVYGTRKDLGQ